MRSGFIRSWSRSKQFRVFNAKAGLDRHGCRRVHVWSRRIVWHIDVLKQLKQFARIKSAKNADFTHYVSPC